MLYPHSTVISSPGPLQKMQTFQQGIVPESITMKSIVIIGSPIEHKVKHAASKDQAVQLLHQQLQKLEDASTSTVCKLTLTQFLPVIQLSHDFPLIIVFKWLSLETG